MAQINMDEIKTGTVNSTEIKKFDDVNHMEGGKQSTELTDNTSEGTEDTNKTKEEEQTETKGGETTGKVVVTYIGGGVWKDSKGELWASQDRAASIKSERQYTADEYEKREDIKFMAQYGSMKVTHVK